MREPFDHRPIHLPGTSSRRPALLLLGLLLLSAALLLAEQRGLLAPLTAQARSVLLPALQTLVGVRAQAEGLQRNMGDAARLQARIATLEAENAQLHARLLTAEPLLQENMRLRAQLRIEEATPWQLLGGEVAALTPDAGRRTLTVARGSADGVKVGMAVIGQEGSSPPALVGVIEQVEPTSATVLLITDYGSAISGHVFHQQERVEGLLRGQWQRGSRLQMEQIPLSSPLAVGDVVLTAGLTNRIGARLAKASIPADVPVGTVVSLAPADHTQTAAVQPFVDPDQVRYVWIIVSHDV
jgi:rod shape-determining protein MreC